MENNPEREDKRKGEAYCKTLLYLYPHMERMAEAMSQSLCTQAMLSYRYAGSTEELVEKLIQCRRDKEILLETVKPLNEIVEGLDRAERFVLEYRYFRRKEELRRYRKEAMPFSQRTFYRRQHSVLSRVCAEMKRRGMDEKWFFENFSPMDWAMTVYKKVEAGRDVSVSGKHRKGLRSYAAKTS